MKSIILSFVTAFIIIGFSACQPQYIAPQTTNAKVDTSSTVMTNTELVGKWYLVSDTVSYQGSIVGYKGTSADHFIFTKYGNLYISETPNKLIDTAIYSISNVNNQVSWTNSYTSINGVASTAVSYSLPYDITQVDSVSLVLTSSFQVTGGLRYEQIKFHK